MTPQAQGAAQQPPAASSPTSCVSCGVDLGPTGVAGFCGQCGGALCPAHVNDTQTVKGEKTERDFYVVASVYKTRSLEAQVAVCKTCLEREKAAYRAHGKKILWPPIIVAVVMFIWFAWNYSWNGVCWGLIVGIGLAICLFLLLNWFFVERKGHNVSVTFACPICGSNLMDHYLELAKATQQTGQMLDYINCPYCRYSGWRRPYDGLYKFVDKYGPGPLESTGLRDMAHLSYNVRRGIRGPI